MSESENASIWGWRGSTTGMTETLRHILQTGEQSDVEFLVGRQYGTEQLFRSHKFILSIRSDVFHKMFYGELMETTKKAIQLPDIHPQAFGLLLKYFYVDDLNDLNMENALQILYCAEKYGIPVLADICTQYTIENVDENTCLAVLEAASVLDSENVVSKCLEIVDVHCGQIFESKEFLQVGPATLERIFSRDTLILSEEKVSGAAERWASNACLTNRLEPTAANRRHVLGEALFLIRFPLMDDGQLANGPLTSGLLLKDELCKIFQFKYGTEKPDLPFLTTLRSRSKAESIQPISASIINAPSRKLLDCKRAFRFQSAVAAQCKPLLELGINFYQRA